MKIRRPFSHRLGVFLIVSLVVYSVAGFILAPLLIKSQLEKRLPTELGRSVRIKSIRINPWILSTTVEGFVVAEKDGGPFVAWDRLYVNFDPTSFFVKEWRFQEITVVAPSGHAVVNKDGTLNFSDLLEKFAPKTEEPAKPAWPLRIAKLVVTGAQLDFADHSRSQEFATHVGPLNFALVQFYTSPNRDAPYDFTAETESGEKLRWSGTMSINPMASEGELHVSAIRPAKYAPYYRDLIRFDVLEGALDVSGKYKISLSDAGNVATLSGGRVHLTGFKIAERSSTEPVVELHDLELKGVEADAETMTASVQKVALIGGRVAAVRDENGKIDLLSMIQPVESPQSPPPSSTPVADAGRKPQVEIADFSVRRLSARFEDRTTPRHAINTIENADIDMQKITLAEGASMPLRVALTLPRGGAATLAGPFSLSPLQATLAVEVTNVALALVSPYVEPFANINITQGAVSVQGEARIALPENQPMEIGYTGDANITQFGAVDGTRKDKLVGWSQLSLKGIDLQGMPLAVTVKEVSWDDPTAHVIVDREGAINLQTVLQPATADRTNEADTKAAENAPATDAAPLPKISIGRVKITNGTFTFADRSVQPEVSTAINQFGGTITGLSTENLAKADVDLQANLGGSGPISITGKLDPLGESKSVDLKVDMKDVELTPFSPYSGKFAGFELARGKLFLDVDAKMQDEALDMSNVVTLTQFTFGAPTQSPDAIKMPVRLAVALLKDTEGKITLDVPVQGSLADPSFRIGKVVTGVIMNLLAKVATSPFSLLGAMFGGGGEELAFQEFVPGEIEVQPDDVKKLETLTKALQGRPALNLEISGSFDTAADGLVLKQRRLAQMVRSRLWDDRRAVDPTVPPPDQLVVTPEDEQAMIRKLFAEKFPDSMPPAAEPPPIPEPEPIAVVPQRRGFFDRATDIVTFKALRDKFSDDDEEDKKPAQPAPSVAQAEPEATTPVPAGPPFEEMKARLMDTIEVNTDDLRRLAARRAERIRDYFMQQNIAGERLFLAHVPEESRGAKAFLQLQ